MEEDNKQPEWGNPRHELYTMLKKDGYYDGDYANFTKNIDNKQGRHELFTMLNEDGYFNGNEDDFNHRLNKYTITAGGKKRTVFAPEYDDFMKRNPSGVVKRQQAQQQQQKPAEPMTAETKKAQPFKPLFDMQADNKPVDGGIDFAKPMFTADKAKQDIVKRNEWMKGKSDSDTMTKVHNEIVRKQLGNVYDRANLEDFYQSNVAPVLSDKLQGAIKSAKAEIKADPVAGGKTSSLLLDPMDRKAEGINRELRQNVAYEKNLDPAVISNSVVNSIDQNALSDYALDRMGFAMGGQTSDSNGVSVPLSPTEKLLIDKLLQTHSAEAVDAIQQRIYKQFRDENAPKSVSDYILSDGWRNSLYGRIQDAVTQKIARSSGLKKQLLDQAYQEFGDKSGAVARGASGAMSMVLDSGAFNALGSGASLVTRGAVGLAGKAIASKAAGELSTEMATRYLLANSALGRTATAMLQSGITFGSYDTLSEGVNQYQQGEFDAGKLVNSYIKGFGTGAAVGALGSAMGEATKNLSGARKFAANAGGFAAEVGLFTGMQGVEQAIAENKSVTDIDWGSLAIQNAAMIGILKVAGMKDRMEKAGDYDLKLNDNDIRVLKSKGYDFSKNGFAALKMVNSGDKQTFIDKTIDPRGEEKQLRENYIKALTDPDIPINTKRKLKYYLEDVIVMAEPVLGYRFDDNEDGTTSLTTTNVLGQTIDVERINTKDVVNMQNKLNREMSFNRATAYNKMFTAPEAYTTASIKQVIEEGKRAGVSIDEDYLDILLEDYRNGKEITNETDKYYLNLILNRRNNIANTSGWSLFNRQNDLVKDETGIDVLDLMRTKRGEQWTPEEMKALDRFNERCDDIVNLDNELRQEWNNSKERAKRLTLPIIDEAQPTNDGDNLHEVEREVQQNPLSDELKAQVDEILKGIEDGTKTNDDLLDLYSNLSGEQEDAIRSYVSSKATMDKAGEIVNNKVSEAVQAERQSKEPFTFKMLGMEGDEEMTFIQPAEFDGRKGYITESHEEGDKSIYKFMPEDGGEPMLIASNDPRLNAQDMMLFDEYMTQFENGVSAQLNSALENASKHNPNTIVEPTKGAIIETQNGKLRVVDVLSDGRVVIEPDEYTMQDGQLVPKNKGVYSSEDMISTEDFARMQDEYYDSKADEQKVVSAEGANPPAETAEAQGDAEGNTEGAETPSVPQPEYVNGKPIVKGADGERSASETANWLAEQSGMSAESVGAYVDNVIKEAQKAADKLSKNSGTSNSTDFAKFMQEVEANRKKSEAAQAELDFWNGVKSELDAKKRAEQDKVLAERRAEQERLTAQAKADEEKRQAEVIAKQKEQEQLGNNNVSPAITQKFNDATKVEGDADEITLANGETISGKYVLVESGAVTPSHNALNGFAPTEGFPVNESGQNVNDRDYQRDADAQNYTRNAAANYDSRAVQTPVIVSKDGVVLSGNGRTMAGEIAAENGTDKAYIQYLESHAGKYGLKPEDVASMNHPRLVFVPDADMPYTSETFAKFNAQEMKGQSKTEQAVKLGKTVDDATFGRILSTVNKFERLGDFYADENAVRDAISELRKSGVISEAQMAEMFDGDVLSPQGKELLENVLIGKAFEQNPDAVRMITSIRSMRQSVVSALSDIVNNVALGEDYTLSNELAEAISLVYEARNKGGVKTGDKVSFYARQGNLFAFDEGNATVADINNMTMLMLADALNNSKVNSLKGMLKDYNNMAKQSANGQFDIFSGDIKTKDDIIKDALNVIGNGKEGQGKAGSNETGNTDKNVNASTVNEKATENESPAMEGEETQTGFVENDFAKSFSDKFKSILNSIGKQIGKAIELMDSKTALEKFGIKALRGVYADENGKIYINVDYVKSGEEASMKILGHELTHMLKKINDPKVWNAYLDAVEKAMGAEFKKEFDRIKAKYDKAFEEAKAQGKEYDKLTDDDIKEEIASDWAGAHVLNDKKFAENLIKNAELDGRSAKQIAQDVLTWIENAIKRLKNMLNKGADVNEQLKAMEQGKQIWTEMYNYAVAKEKESIPQAEKAQIIEDAKNIVDGNTTVEGVKGKGKFSVSSTFEGAGLEASTETEAGKVPLVNERGDMIVKMGDKVFDGNHPLTVDDIKAHDNSIINYMMKDALELGAIDGAQAEKIYGKYADLMNYYLKEGLSENKGVDNVTSKWQWLGESIFRTVATNGDKQYSYSLDITRICKKNEAVINGISEMQTRVGYGITPAQILDIFNNTVVEGYQAPCPVCYVFSRYIRNGKYASAAINGMLKYGKHLKGQPEEWTAKQWVKELERLDALKSKYSKEITKANNDVTTILSTIDDYAKKITDPNTSDADKKKLTKEVEALDKRYRKALDVVSQMSLTNWIKSFAIQSKKSQWEVRDDAYMPEDMEDFKNNALDLRKTANTMVKYPAIQRLRKSGGAAAGKEITQASNNEFGGISMALNTSDPSNSVNWYQEAVKATTEEEREKCLKKAREQYTKAVLYSARQSLRGGQRMWSWSDNIERLANDIALNLIQEEMLGGAVQSYSKQLEGINLVARMGAYVNGSLMGKGLGYREVSPEEVVIVNGDKVVKGGEFKFTDVDGKEVVIESPVYEENGKLYTLEFDPVVGIDAFGKTDENGNHLKGLFELNHTLSKAGNILVGMNDIHCKAAMADRRVFFIIPWHASGANAHVLAQMYNYLGVRINPSDAIDYTDMQEEKDYSKGSSKIPARMVAIWDSHRNEDDFACGIKGGIPSGDGKGKVSQQQVHYRELRDAILRGIKGTILDKEGKEKTIYTPIEENKKWMTEIKADAFLSQVYDKVRGFVGNEGMTNEDCNHIYPYEYWDENSTFDTADVNGARYLEYCRRLGFKPKFCGNFSAKKGSKVANKGNFIDSSGYWKTLIDRRMYDINGKFQDLTPVNSEGYDPKLADPDLTKNEFEVTRVADDEGVTRIVQKALEDETKRSGSVAAVDYANTLESAVKKYNNDKAKANEGMKFSVDGNDGYDIGFSRSKEQFNETQRIAIDNTGIVLPKIADQTVDVIKVNKFDFDGKKPSEWARENLITERLDGKKIVYDEVLPTTLDGTPYSISTKAVDKFVSGSSTHKEDGYDTDTHIKVLPYIKDVISNSIDAEIHPNYRKKNGDRYIENGYYSDSIVHRLYGAVSIDGDIYRIKTTLLEFKGNKQVNRPHAFEVEEIELIDESINSSVRQASIDVSRIDGANLLKNVEKSYDKGKKLLDESPKFSQIVQNDGIWNLSEPLDAYDPIRRAEQVNARNSELAWNGKPRKSIVAGIDWNEPLTEDGMKKVDKLVTKMSDEELLQAIDAQGKDASKALHPSVYDEYDSRNEENYIAHYDMASSGIDSKETADEILANAQKEWNDGGYATSDRTALAAQMDAASDWIAANDAESNKTSLANDNISRNTLSLSEDNVSLHRKPVVDRYATHKSYSKPNAYKDYQGQQAHVERGVLRQIVKAFGATLPSDLRTMNGSDWTKIESKGFERFVAFKALLGKDSEGVKQWHAYQLLKKNEIIRQLSDLDLQIERTSDPALIGELAGRMDEIRRSADLANSTKASQETLKHVEDLMNSTTVKQAVVNVNSEIGNEDGDLFDSSVAEAVSDATNHNQGFKYKFSIDPSEEGETNTYDKIGKETFTYQIGTRQPDLTLVGEPGFEGVKFAGDMPMNYQPKRYGVAYKLMEKYPDGSYHALFAGIEKPIQMGQMNYAYGIAKDKLMSEMGLRERYGWHFGSFLPSAPHLMGIGSATDPSMSYPSKTGKGYHPKGSKRVWVKVLYDASNDWNALADQTKKGDLYGLVPFGGYYAFQEGNLSYWILSSGAKFDGELSEEERQQILKDAGYDEEKEWATKTFAAKMKGAITSALNNAAKATDPDKKKAFEDKAKLIEQKLRENPYFEESWLDGSKPKKAKMTPEEAEQSRQFIISRQFDNPDYKFSVGEDDLDAYDPLRRIEQVNDSRKATITLRENAKVTMSKVGKSVAEGTNILCADNDAEVDELDVPQHIKDVFKETLTENTRARYVDYDGKRYIMLPTSKIDPDKVAGRIGHELGHQAVVELDIPVDEMIPVMFMCGEKEPEILNAVTDLYGDEPEVWAEECTMHYIGQLIDKEGLDNLYNTDFVGDTEQDKDAAKVLTKIVNYIKNGQERPEPDGTSHYQSKHLQVRSDNSRGTRGDENEYQTEKGMEGKAGSNAPKFSVGGNDDGLDPYDPIKRAEYISKQRNADGLRSLIGLGDDIADEYTQKKDERNAKLPSIAASARGVRKALTAQRKLDEAAVKSIADYIRAFVRGGYMTQPSGQDMLRMLTQAKNAVGRENIEKEIGAVADKMIDHHIKVIEDAFDKLTKVKEIKVDQSGVQTIGKVGVQGQRQLKAYREGKSMSIDGINNRLNDIADILTNSNDEALKAQVLDEYRGLERAVQYKEMVEGEKQAISDLKNQKKSVREAYTNGTISYNDYLSTNISIDNAIREEKLNLIDNIAMLYGDTQVMMEEGVIEAKEFEAKELARKCDIRHMANSDMQGRPATEYTEKENDTAKVIRKTINFFARPLATFDTMLRMFGDKSPRGEGYLFHHFMGEWVESAQNEQLGFQYACDKMHAKASEIFGKKKMDWSDIYKYSDKKMGEVGVYDKDVDGKVYKTVTQGQALYIYLVNNMVDGQMKLRKQGITEEDVASLAEHIDPRLMQLGQWMVSDFLPELRNKYNAVHERIFGAPMATVENYFPLRIIKNSIVQDQDVATIDFDPKLASTKTGSIIKRTRNLLPIDISQDAFKVALENVIKMENWAAFARLRKDINVLISYNRFNNQVRNMTLPYGKGEDLLKLWIDCCRLATGTYTPSTKSDNYILKATQGVTKAKIAFRGFTAFKQLFSGPAALSEVNPINYAGHWCTFPKSWEWCMNNLPIFKKRWESRFSGDVILPAYSGAVDEWYSKFQDKVGRYGMTPNAALDAVTCACIAHSRYDKVYAEYLDYGFSPEEAHKEAIIKAEICYNETQQSNEGAFTSPFQAERTWYTTLLTLFRNSPMAYGRRVWNSLSDGVKMIRNKEAVIEHETKAFIRKGLDEEQAKRAAEKKWWNAVRTDAADVAIFGFLLQLLWNAAGKTAGLGAMVLTELFNDKEQNDKQSEYLWDTIWSDLKGESLKASFGSVEGFAAGNYISNLLYAVTNGSLEYGFDAKAISKDIELIGRPTIPIESDFENLVKQSSSDPLQASYSAACLLSSMLAGADLKTFTDVYLAFADATNGNMDKSSEIIYAAMRMMAMPKESTDRLFFYSMYGEVYDKDGNINVEALRSFAFDYAHRMNRRDNPFTQDMYTAEERAKRDKKYMEKFNNKLKELDEDLYQYKRWIDSYSKNKPLLINQLPDKAIKTIYLMEQEKKELGKIKKEEDALLKAKKFNAYTKHLEEHNNDITQLKRIKMIEDKIDEVYTQNDNGLVDDDKMIKTVQEYLNFYK